MNVKTFIAATVIALTAACTQEPEAVPTEAVTGEAVELNEDGSVKDSETDNAAGASLVAPVGQQHQL